MCDDGTVNVGQIINEEHKPEEVFLGSFLPGTVIAGREVGCYAGDSSGKSTVGNMNCTNSRLKRIVFMTEAMREHREQEFGHRDRGVSIETRTFWELCSK
jgi:hypothetical protein